MLGAKPAPRRGRPQASARWRHVLAVPLTAPLSSGPGRLCRSYKRLDKCQHQIAPREVKYQLHNKGTRTLFHCNCTRRCASGRKRQGFSHHHGALCADSWGPGGLPALAGSCRLLPSCARRLGRFLHRARDLSDVEVAVLADRIATVCFVLEPPTDCSPGEGSQHK